MRSRTLLLLVLVLPVLAGNDDPFATAIEHWRSPDPARRDLGSRLADRELRARLAPVLRAMEDEDPDVRRRARRAILALVGERPDPFASLREEFGRVGHPQMRNALLSHLSGLQALRKRARALEEPPAAPIPVRRWGGGEARRAAADTSPAELVALRLGVTAKTTREAGAFDAGLRIDGVERGSAAAAFGLADGDVIVKVNDWRIASLEELAQALGTDPDWRKVKLTVVRGRKAATRTLADGDGGPGRR